MTASRLLLQPPRQLLPLGDCDHRVRTGLRLQRLFLQKGLGLPIDVRERIDEVGALADLFLLLAADLVFFFIQSSSSSSSVDLDYGSIFVLTFV